MVPRRRGKIINIASILALVGTGDTTRPGPIAYAASKGGVVSLTRSLAAEWAQYDINVNAIAPGLVPTKMTKGLIEIMGERAASKAPLNRVGGPEDLKGITVLFASDACSFITGRRPCAATHSPRCSIQRGAHRHGSGFYLRAGRRNRGRCTRPLHR